MVVTIARTDQEIRQCLPALLLLRPHLTADEAFSRIRFQQEHERFVLAFINDGGERAPAVIGYRTMHLLYSGKTLYIDDLSTIAEARGKGYASALLDFVVDEARKGSYQCVSLDSGQNPARYDAHRLYLSKRFNITSHHFKLDL
ncbi:GNAT family N-acetyltransferase [Spirosoma soli]|uniref:GNAT family N-acetyltransferase n=1 Tax=Spirosoma soli TaxID=1770529 RepID=A0ABW5MDB2_9BACT